MDKVIIVSGSASKDSKTGVKLLVSVKTQLKKMRCHHEEK